MNIHEYQAKNILKGFGAPIADGIVVSSLEEAHQALGKLICPVWVVKSQIHAGGRGKGRFLELGPESQGGVRVATSKEQVLLNVEEMLGKTLVTEQTGPEGKQVNKIYIEMGANINKELYFSLLIDRVSGRVCAILSTEGGMDIEAVAKDSPGLVHSFEIDPNTGCTQTMALEMGKALNLSGLALESCVPLFKNLYFSFLEKDMSLLEINPLIVTSENELQVLDAKMSFDDNALFRQLDILELRDETEEDPKEIEASKFDLSYIALDGEIGCMVNGAGLAMATMDIIKLYGGKPANFLDVGGGATAEKVTAAFKIITSDPNVKGILVNIFGGIMRCDVIAQGVVQAIKDVGLTVPLVVRLEGTRVSEGKNIINESGLNVIAADNLDDAAKKIVDSVKEL